MNSANEDSFNFEDFLAVTEAESAVPEAESAVAEESAVGWDQYPSLFETDEKHPTSLINFNGASLMKEEFFDPFAALQKPQEREAFQFLDKLKLRKNKLEQLAKNLSVHSKELKTGISPLLMKAHLKSHWNNLGQRAAVQAFPIFNLSIPTISLKSNPASSFRSNFDLEFLVENTQNLYFKSQTTNVKPASAEEIIMATVLRETLFTYPSAL
jgi:hypothetical protein